MADHDHSLDAALRNAPPPADAERLASAEAVFSDESLDRLLADLPLPTGIVDRLRAAVERPAGSRRGGAIDLERIATSPRPTERRRSFLARWSVALARDGIAVAAALSVAWAVFTVGREFSRRLAAPADVAVVTAMPRPAAPPERGVAMEVALDAPPPAMPAGSEPEAPADEPPRVAGGPAGATVADQGPVPVAAAPPAAVPSVRGAAVGAAVPTPTDGGGGLAGRLVEQPREAWRLVPRVRGFDLAFEMAHGEPPFADPSIAGLATDAPPLSLRTTSFDRLAAGDMPWRSPVRGFRMEDLLAAVPPPVGASSISASDAVDLRVLGVRSLRRVRGQTSLLVEVAATASAAGRAHEPLEATLVIDRSAGSDPIVWPWLCHAVAAVAQGMAPDDRLSLVVAGPVPRLAVRRGDAAAIAAAATDLSRLPSTDVADLDAAVRLAASTPDAANRPLIVLARRDTAERARDEARSALASWHETRASTGGEPLAPPRGRERVGFVLVDATAAPGPAPDDTTFGSTAADPTAIRREALRQVFATERLVARQCRLAVSFAPASVASWRLVGHRQSVVESLATTSPQPLDLHGGETARAIYEVVPRGSATPAVSAVLDWRAAADGAPRRARATLDSAAADLTSPLPSPHGCEILLAVAVAEAAAASVHADPAATVAATDLLRRWHDRGDVSTFGTVLATCLERHAGGRRSPR